MASASEQAAKIYEDAMQSIFDSELKPEQLEALFKLYPYLQIVNGKVDNSKMTAVEYKTAETGWRICDYGEAMSSSTPLFMTGENYPTPGLELDEDEEDEDEGGITGEGSSEEEEAVEEFFGPLAKEGSGTLVAQAFNTAQQMIAMASQRGWQGVIIADGNEFMKRSAWIGCEVNGMAYGGFTPNDDDWKRYDRIANFSEAEIARILAIISNKNSGPTSTTGRT